jgi:alpha-beta hydrolase superfamily lysophospholipase
VLATRLDHGITASGTADPFAPYQQSLQAIRDMATEGVTVRLCEDGRHEVLNEINRNEVIDDLATWIRRVA